MQVMSLLVPAPGRRVLLTLALAVSLVVPVLALPAGAQAAQPCWKRLVNDWFDGRIEGTYPIPCYRQAIDNLVENAAAMGTRPIGIS